ncbi:MAG: DeoR/GlpR transcriptional regulator [Phycisphaerales bacterium]|nr:DeoR/GlpR transcriptional regulator [Phycisphaerales bacterium]
MLIPERQSRLSQLLAMRGMVNLEVLAGELGVSTSTVRRDVESLEQQGQVRRTHGGVIWIGEDRGGAATRPYAFDQRMVYQHGAKQKIAAAARQFVSPGQTILIDGGTTTFYLAELLQGQPLQLLTNSLPIANIFLNDDKVELILAGGMMYPRYGVLLGPITEQTLTTLHYQTMFFSVAGVVDGLLYNQNMLLVQSQRQMIQQSQRVVLLVDSSKFGQRALSHLGDLNEVDVVISDSGLDQAQRDDVRNRGCELVIAE